MEGDGQRQLKPQLRQAADAGQHAAGGQGDVPHSDVQAVGVVHQLQKFQHGVQVVHGFADAHQHDVGDGRSGVLPGENYLIQQLPRRQVPDLARDGGRAEGAPHPASHLRGDAHGVPVAVAHQDGLNAVAVRQLPEVFDGAVPGGDLFPDRLGNGEGTGLLQPLPERGREIGHLVKGRRPPAEPGEDLLPPEGGLSHFLKEGPQLREGHGFDIGHGSPQIRRVMRQM